MCKQNVEYCTNNKRTKNADWHISFWVFSFLCSSAYSIKSYISKKHDGCCSYDTAKTILAKSAGVWGNIGSIIFLSYIMPAKKNKNKHYGYFKRNDNSIY